MAIHDAQVEARVAIQRSGLAVVVFLIQFLIRFARDDAEMRLFQPAHHVGHDGAGFVHGGGFFDFGAQFVVDGLPVHAVQFGIPVLVAHGFPDLLEGIDV